MFVDFDWVGVGLLVECCKLCDGDLVGLIGCFCVIVEMGLLVLLFGFDIYVLVGLLLEIYIVIVLVLCIVVGYEDVFVLICVECGELLCVVNFVFGLLCMGDIE